MDVSHATVVRRGIPRSPPHLPAPPPRITQGTLAKLKYDLVSLPDLRWTLVMAARRAIEKGNYDATKYTDRLVTRLFAAILP